MNLSYALFNFCSFTYTISQVVQLSTANFTMTDNFYFNNVWGVQWPCFLNAYSVRALSYCESFSCASTLFLKNCSFKYLNTFTVSFFDQCVYSYCVSCTELRYFSFQLFCFNVSDNVVNFFSPILIWMFLIHDM